MDIRSEISFQTARSSGSGGQNVNKVETMVLGRWSPEFSQLLNERQKALLLHTIGKRLTNSGELLVRSQEARSQLENKEIVIEKMNRIVTKGLEKTKPRIATKPTKGSKEKRLESKKRHAEIKSGRGKFRF